MGLRPITIAAQLGSCEHVARNKAKTARMGSCIMIRNICEGRIWNVFVLCSLRWSDIANMTMALMSTPVSCVVLWLSPGHSLSTEIDGGKYEAMQ